MKRIRIVNSKPLIIIFFLSFCLSFFCGCKTKYSVEFINETETFIQASLQIPVYEKYKDISDYVKTELLKDYESYKEFANDIWNSYQEESTYRTVFKDMSNSKYINVYILKYIPASSTREDEYVITFCYDKKKKQLVDITQITGMNIEELSTYCKNYLKKNVKNVSAKEKEYIDEYIDRRMVPLKKRYSSFCVQNKKVVIYFAPDEILPRDYGIQTVEIPF